MPVKQWQDAKADPRRDYPTEWTLYDSVSERRSEPGQPRKPADSEPNRRLPVRQNNMALAARQS